MVSLFFKSYIFANKLHYFYNLIDINLFLGYKFFKKNFKLFLFKNKKSKNFFYKNNIFYNFYLLRGGDLGSSNFLFFKNFRSYDVALPPLFFFKKRKIKPVFAYSGGTNILYKKNIFLKKQTPPPFKKTLIFSNYKSYFYKKPLLLPCLKNFSFNLFFLIYRKNIFFYFLKLTYFSQVTYLLNNIYLNRINFFFYLPTATPTKIYSYPSVHTLSSKSFILHYVGFYLPIKFNFKFFFKKIVHFREKKRMYSFLKPNETRRKLFFHKKKMMIIKLIKKIDKYNIAKNFFFKSTYLYSFFNFKKSLKSTPSNTNLFNRLPILLNENIYKKDSFRANTMLFNSDQKKNFFYHDVRIERVKFKPGYQRLWRISRRVLAESLYYRYIYQKQLTTHLVKFYRRVHSPSYYITENNLVNVIIYSRLISDFKLIDLFLINSFIFLNHKPTTIANMYVYKNDLVQLEITIWFYIFSKWIFSWTKNRTNKFKRLVYKKSLAGHYKVMKRRKIRSSRTPLWIFNTRFDFIDIKPFLEVDYFTLSVFLIYDFKFFFFYRPEIFLENRQTLYKLYNWKYVN